MQCVSGVDYNGGLDAGFSEVNLKSGPGTPAGSMERFWHRKPLGYRAYISWCSEEGYIVRDATLDCSTPNEYSSLLRNGDLLIEWVGEGEYCFMPIKH